MLERDHFFHVQQNRVTCKPKDFFSGHWGRWIGGLNFFFSNILSGLRVNVLLPFADKVLAGTCALCAA